MKSQLRRKSTSTVATRILWCVPICLLIVAAIFTATKSPAQTVATIVTSQKFYSVGETMTVLGKGFTPGVGIAISVLRPDHQTDVVNGTIADGTGSFSSNYTPPLMPGRYKITATDGTNSATTATTEADSIGFNKAVYDKNDQTYAGGAGHWTTGNAGSNYLEGQWAFYQYEVTGVPVEFLISTSILTTSRPRPMPSSSMASPTSGLAFRAQPMAWKRTVAKTPLRAARPTACCRMVILSRRQIPRTG